MFSYYFFFSLPIVGVFTHLQYKKNLDHLLWFLLIVSYIFIIGFRYQVGGDWETYTHGIIEHTEGFNPLNFNIRSDYGYELLTWVSYNLGFGIYGSNIISSIIFITALSHFCFLQPNKWLAILVSFPVIIIVLGMGFTRQGVAFAFLLFALISLIKKNNFLYFAYMFLSVLFHKSIVIFLPIYLLSIEKFNFKKILIFLFFLLITISLVYTDLKLLFITYVINRFENNEAGTGLVSYGVYYRLFLNLIPALIMLIYRNKITNNIIEKRIFVFFSLLIFIYFSFSSLSVVVDRMNLYTSILQVYVLSRLCYIFDGTKKIMVINFLVVIYYFLVLFVWLNFAVNSSSWIPYMNYFFHK